MKEKKDRRTKPKLEKGSPKFLAWECVNLSLQIEEFFDVVRHLNNKRFNPRIELTFEHVSEIDIDEVFGPLKQPKYKYTNSTLHPNIIKGLVRLCWQIYGTFVITNNDFASWVVKGFIAQKKGVNVNWATIVAWTEKEEACKLKAMALKFEGIELSGVTISWKLDTREDFIKNHVVLVKNFEVKKGLCPFNVSSKAESMVKYTQKSFMLKIFLSNI